MAYTSQVTAALYDDDGTTLISGALDNAYDIQWLDELNGLGFGSLRLQVDDAGAASCTRGRFVKCSIGGTVRFSFRISNSPEKRTIQVGEEYEQVIEVAGRGWGEVFEDAIVYPDPAIDGPLDASWRLFSFASPDFPNAGAWVAAQQHYEYHDGLFYGSTMVRKTRIYDVDGNPTDYPAPVGFPWPNSHQNGNADPTDPGYTDTHWIWPGGEAFNATGFAFFRSSFTLGSETNVTFAATADNYWTLFLDGVPILGEATEVHCWSFWKEITLPLVAGTYTVAAVVENPIYPAAPNNPGGFIYTAHTMTDDEPATLIHSTSTGTWTSEFAPTSGSTEWPGWTPGQIIPQLVTEATTRGPLSAYVGDTFTATLDSGSNAWDNIDPSTTTSYIPTFATRVGATLLDVLDQLHEEGWIDWHFQAGTLTLDAWAGGQAGSTPGVSFVAGTNITSLERGDSAPFANALLVQWEQSYTEVLDSTSISTYGRVEDIYSTDATSKPDAQRLGRVELLRRAAEARGAVVLGVLPTSTADAPYDAFAVGDFVTVPADGGGTESIQVLSIQVRQDEEGFPEFTLELNERFRLPPRDTVELIRNLGGKALGAAGTSGVVK